MRIVIPIAGPSVHFKPEDHPYPKPVIDIAGRPMIAWAVESLGTIGGDPEFIFVTLAEDALRFSYEGVIREATQGRYRLVMLRRLTAGALCSCLLAIDHIPEDEEVVVANSDQVFDMDLGPAVDSFRAARADAGVLTIDSIHPRWSYVKSGPDRRVVQAAEKLVISRNAVAGFYYFRTGKLFIEAAMYALENGVQVNGQYYVAPILNHLILSGMMVMHLPIDPAKYHSFYSPQTIVSFERWIASKAVGSER